MGESTNLNWCRKSSMNSSLTFRKNQAQNNNLDCLLEHKAKSIISPIFMVTNSKKAKPWNHPYYYEVTISIWQ